MGTVSGPAGCIWRTMMPHCLLAKFRCIRVKGWVYKGYGRHADMPCTDCSDENIQWVEEMVHQLVDGLSQKNNHNHIVYSVS